MKSTDITSFFTNRNSMVYFLALTTFFTVLAVVFGSPELLLRHTEGLSATSPVLQISFSALVGLFIIAVSRWLLLRFGRKQDFTPAGIGIWLLSELLLSVSAMSTMLWLAAGRGHLMLTPLAGDLTLFSLVLQVVPYVVTYLLFQLHAERAEVERLRAMLSPKENEVRPSPDPNVHFVDRGGKLVLSTLRNNILYIEAANNYTNIHYLLDDREETFILHNSLKELEHQFEGSTLVRCHRGYMVNLENVKLMRRESTGFVLELSGAAKHVPVTKTYSDQITRLIRTE